MQNNGQGAWKDAGGDSGKDYDEVQDKTNLAKYYYYYYDST